MINSIIPAPHVYGLPAEKFSQWRTGQAEAAMRTIETQKRFPVVVAPTGFGKSGVGEVIARFMGRSMYLTVTKALQDQIAREFTDRFDIRGRSNYDCAVLLQSDVVGWQAKVDQADGLCEGCHLKERGCTYYDAMREARQRLHDVSNYAKWLSTDEESFGEFDVLICDEAHDAADQLSKSLKVELRPRAVDQFCHQPIPQPQPMPQWGLWANRHLQRLKPQLDGLAQAVAAGNHARRRELKELRGLVKALETIAVVRAGWVEDRSEQDGKVSFEPVWPKKYGGRLFRGVGKVVLMSATVTRKDLELLGVPAEQADFAEYPSSFPIANRPVIAVPTVRMSGSMSEQEKIEAVRRIDQIIDGRLDRNGIIDTVSFARGRHLLEHSRHAPMMLFNDPLKRGSRTTAEWTADVVEEFRRRGAKEPCVLVGPSFSTGWDFPYTEAEYGIVMKIGFLNRHESAVAEARCKEDDEYDGFQAMKRIVQFSGRGMRAKDDRFEVLITDDMWTDWFLKVNRKHAPQWFLAAVRGPEPIPRPLEKLMRRIA